MKFFNQKEDILDFQLTNYGKKLFFEGKLKPSYYSISDEGVLYNLSASDSSSSEEQNDIKTRIIEQTPYLNVQQNVLSTSKDGKNFNLEGFQFETEQAKLTSLGSCETEGSSSSDLKLVLLSGEIKTFSNFMTASTSAGHADIAIPQINIDLEFKTAIEKYQDPELPFEVPVYDTLSREEVFADGGTVYIQSDQILLLVEENGTLQRFDNFEIEVFEIMEEDENFLGEVPLRKLDFIKRIEDSQIQNNIFVDDEEIARARTLINRYPETTSDVDYYFDIFSDAYGELSKDFLCNFVKEMKNKQFLTSLINFDCEDEVRLTRAQNVIYDSGIDEPEKC